MSKSLKYLGFIRAKKCLCCNKPGVPHHVEAVGMGRNRSKPREEHYATIPLCYKHHNELHTIGITRWLKKHEFTLDGIYKTMFKFLQEFIWDYD